MLVTERASEVPLELVDRGDIGSAPGSSMVIDRRTVPSNVAAIWCFSGSVVTTTV